MHYFGSWRGALSASRINLANVSRQRPQHPDREAMILWLLQRPAAGQSLRWTAVCLEKRTTLQQFAGRLVIGGTRSTRRGYGRPGRQNAGTRIGVIPVGNSVSAVVETVLNISREVRTRLLGGVGRVAGRGRPYPIRWIMRSH